MDGNNKRPMEEGDDEVCGNDVKKSKVIVGPTTSRPQSSTENVGLSTLCDDIIMHIFRYLSHDHLVNMSFVCSTLSRVSQDWTLWKKVWFNEFDKSMEDVYMNYLKDMTTRIFIKGKDDPSYDSSVSHKFIIQLEAKCPELTHLSLVNQIFDSNEITPKILHRKLKYLRMHNTVIENITDSSSYLCGLNITCPDLEEIRMTFNEWFLPHCLYALAKLEKLLHLSLHGCRQFKNCIPYASITAITGFKTLRTLDLRLTPVSDHELVCFQRLKNLKTVLLECPDYIDPSGGTTITDLGVSGFCHNSYEFHYPYIQIMIDIEGEVNLRRVNNREDYNDKCKIENLYVRNYPLVTDAFLKSAAKSCPFIKFLDVSGTSCTADEVGRYKAKKPNVEMVFETCTED